MSSTASPREAYVDTLAEVRRAEADRSQVLTGLSHLEALFDAARRGEADADVPTAVREHVDVVAELDYDRTAFEDAGLLADEPTFDAFDVDGPKDVPDALDRFYRNEGEEAAVQFDDLVACLRDAIAGGGDSLGGLAEHVDGIVDAFEAGDRKRFDEQTKQLVYGFRKQGVRTGADLEDLLEAERGPFYGEDLLALQNDSGVRSAAIEDLADAVESGETTAFVAARRPFGRAARALSAFAAIRREDLGDLVADLTEAYPDDHADPHPELETETPVLLTPTRLETRFVERDGDPGPNQPSHDLLVRVYPDDVHVDTHERALTDAEVERGAWFWEQVWWASHRGDADALEDAVPAWMLEGVELAAFPDDAGERHAAVKERAWNTLAERFGPERAAWVKRAMAPEEREAMLAGPAEMGPVEDADPDEFAAEMGAIRDGVDRRPGSWTRPPRARLLPDRWVAFAETDDGERTATSEPVRPPLSIGPDPGSIESAVDADEDYDIRSGEIDWVFDFEAAEDVGMALRIPLTESEVSAGVDRLTVLGVSTGLDETDAASELADLLEAHRYTDGLSVLERGTPTNDTREDAAATSPSGDESIYERECTLPAVSPDDRDADGVRIAELLGVDPAAIGEDRPFVFDRVPGAARSLDATAAATNAALWSSTVGYYVPHLLVPFQTFFDADLDFFVWLENYRRHFVSYVRAGGPVPPLRIDSQPYGIVPTTAYGSWTEVPALATTPEPLSETAADYPDQGVSSHLADLLETLRPIWEDAVDRVPSVESPDDPEVVVSELLSMAGTSYGYRLRDLVGSEAAAALSGDLGDDSSFEAARTATRDQLERAAGTDHVPRVGDLLAVDEEAPVVDAPVVTDDLPSVLRALRTTRYDVLRTGPPGVGFDLDIGDLDLDGLDLADLADLDGMGGTWLWAALLGGADRSLAAVLCYNAILQEYRFVMARLGNFNFAERAAGSLVPEPQVYEEGDRTMWDALDFEIDTTDGPLPMGEIVRLVHAVDGDVSTEDGEVEPFDPPFADLATAFETLEDADPAVLEQLFRETLDLASHRYDAWATSLATRRLEGMREAGGEGLYVGAYGYVENLERETDGRSKGYIQAPSIDQATAAAVLRSAHDAETEEYGDLFAVDLSAERVREARALLEGVRAGSSLGELVGARFERALHEDSRAELDQYVYAFRSLAPLVEGRVERDGMEDSDAVAEREVVDGATLYELWRNDAIPWGDRVGRAEIDALPPDDEDDDAFVAIREHLQAVETAFDSVSDVLAAEGVYQLVRDNPERAGAALSALSRGEAVEDLEVTRTPRTGTSCTHRVLALLDPTATGSAWAPGDSPRASAEPSLDDWVSTLVGDPARVVCRVAYEAESASDGGAETTEGDEEADPDWHVLAVRLSQLDLSALDVVSLVAGDEAAWGSELEARIEYHVRRTRDDVLPDGELRMSFAPPADWPDAEAIGADPDTDVGFGELLEVARGARSVVSNARPVDARDVSVPGEATGAGRVIGDLDERAAEATEAFSTALDDLAAQVPALAADPETGERVVDDLVALVEATAAVPADGLADVTAALDSFDGAGLHEDLQALVDAVTGSGPLLARDDAGDVVLGPDGPVVGGLVDAGLDVAVTIEDADGQEYTASVTADDDGRFRAEFDPADHEPGDQLAVTATDDAGGTVTADGRFEADRPPHALPLPALRALAEVAAALEPVAEAGGQVVAAGAALDDDAIDDAVDALEDDVWSPNEAADLEAVRAVPSVSVPGFDTPSGWRRLAFVARAVGEGAVGAGTVSEAELDETVPSATALEDFREALGTDVTDLAVGVGAAERRPDEALVAAALETIRGALLVCADYGIHGAVPLSAAGASREDLETLARQGASVHEEAAGMYEVAVRHRDRGDTQDDPEAYVACLEALFGESFTVLVPFEPTNAAELADAIEPAHSEALQGGDPLAVERWFDRVVRVREEAARFGRALTYGETLGERSAADGARFRVGQLPFDAEDAWVGLPEAWADEHPTGRLSLVAHTWGSQPGTRYVGLFVDEFVETVPNDTETTGLSVHYDRPANQAPQSMLLAVAPTAENWSVETLADVVRESVDLAKLRTVDRDALADLGQLLPGLALATNESANLAGPDTASIDPADLVDDWWAHWGGGA